MSRRAKDRLFADFDAWGFDQRGWAQATRRGYVRRVRRADAWLVEHRSVGLLHATPRDLAAYLFSTKPTASTRNQNRQALIAFGDFALDRGARVDNPAKGLPRLPVPERLPKAYSREQAERILAVACAFPPFERSLILLLLLGGLRRTEARTLEWRHVEPDGSWIHFPGKGGRERAVPLRDEVRDAVLALRAGATDPRWMFPSPVIANRPIGGTWVEHLMDDVEERTGITGLHAHALRHTIATLLLEDGADIRDVQVFLGHRSIRTTVGYTRIRPARVREAVDRVRLNGQRRSG